jgi:hypothetical protein
MELTRRRVYALSFLLLAFPILYAIDWKLTEKFWEYRISLGAAEFFIFLAFVPGIVATVYHLVTVTQRREQNLEAVKAYYVWRNKRSTARPHQSSVGHVEDRHSTPVSAVAATILLVAVFLFVAVVAGYMDWNGTSPVKGNAATARAGMRGIVISGLGAYVAVLYFMVARLYASALSSRFLMANAIGSASAVAMGWTLSIVGIGAFGADATSLNMMTVLFLTGLFHKWAFDALRRRARKLFGQPEPETIEMPINSIEGIDDVHADMLSEYGVSTVQHLATGEPGEICERTLLPFDRVLDWMDQAILITYFKKNITAARALGIRGAINLVLIAQDATDPQSPQSKLLDSLAEKASMPRAAIDAIAKELQNDYTLLLINELREGKPLVAAHPPDLVQTVMAKISNDYEVVDLTVPPAKIGRLQIRSGP